MKAILKFSLPKDEWNHKRALEGADLYHAVTSFKNRLKNILKHDDNATDTHQEIYDMFLQELSDNDITLD